MPALYPMMARPEDFRPGDCVRKFINEREVTPFIGVVTHIVPSTYKVWVQWPIENSQESPETLIKVNPEIFGMPTVNLDKGYDSYEKSISEANYGKPMPPSFHPIDRMALRIAHTFATSVVGKMIDDIVKCHEDKLSSIQTYNRIYDKYANTCSDYIVRSSIQKIYEELEGDTK